MVSLMSRKGLAAALFPATLIRVCLAAFNLFFCVPFSNAVASNAFACLIFASIFATRLSHRRDSCSVYVLDVLDVLRGPVSFTSLFGTSRTFILLIFFPIPSRCLFGIVVGLLGIGSFWKIWWRRWLGSVFWMLVEVLVDVGVVQ